MQLTKRRKNSIFTFVIRLGGVAQLVERLNGIQEVRGSTPLISTTDEKNEPDFIGFFFFSRALRGDAVPPAAWTPSDWHCVYAIFWGPRGILCTRGEKEHTSKRVSVIAPDNAISKAQCATCISTNVEVR